MPDIEDPWDVAQLPHIPPDQLKRWVEVLSNHYHTYNDQWDRLFGPGVYFNAVFGDGVGTTASLMSNGSYGDPPDGTIGDHWSRWDTGKAFPAFESQANIWPLFVVRLASFSFLYDPADIQTYPPAIRSLPALLNEDFKFVWGLTVRICWRICQLKCAAMIANILGLDNRGRPAH